MREARDQLKVLQLQVNKTLKWIKTNNMPGLPEQFKKFVDESMEAIKHVHTKLEEKPLDMASVKLFLEEATIAVNAFTTMTKELINKCCWQKK